MIIDTHCHLNHELLRDDIDECLERAEAASVGKMIVVGYDLDSSREAVRLAELHSYQIYAAIGIHPHDSLKWNRETESWLSDLAGHPKVVAIGEIGLDYHYDFSPRTDQDTAFRAQINLAHLHNLPVIIHCREAYPQTLALLNEECASSVSGVMHCWAGTCEEAQQSLEMGLHLGFGGTLTFKNAQNVRDSALLAPMCRLLVETDAPYLAPVPFRGKRCEPAYSRIVTEKLAELKGVPVEQIAFQTTVNAEKLFPKMTW